MLLFLIRPLFPIFAFNWYWVDSWLHWDPHEKLQWRITYLYVSVNDHYNYHAQTSPLFVLCSVFLFFQLLDRFERDLPVGRILIIDRCIDFTMHWFSSRAVYFWEVTEVQSGRRFVLYWTSWKYFNLPPARIFELNKMKPVRRWYKNLNDFSIVVLMGVNVVVERRIFQ